MRRKEADLILTLTILKIILPTTEIIALLGGKIGVNFPATEALKMLCLFHESCLIRKQFTFEREPTWEAEQTALKSNIYHI